MPSVIDIKGLTKTYASGLQALKPTDLQIGKGEIFALLGPNGAGKTTLISIVCGIVTPTSGSVIADGHDIQKDYRPARMKIGLVPQELTTDAFETVLSTVSFSRGLFGKSPDPAFIEKTLRSLSLWDKKDAKIMTLSGGMKRRVMIAKALSHEPTILFLDEPTAGVDVELRRDMWALVRQLREDGVTIILTTHYIEEAEEMADRVGVILKGDLILVEEKTALMKKLGRKTLTLNLQDPLAALPPELADWALTLKADGNEIEYVFDSNADETGVPSLLRKLSDLGITFKDLNTRQSSLEDIFVGLVHHDRDRSGLMGMNGWGVWSLYRFEMARFGRTIFGSLVTPVMTTALYFVVFGSAIGGRMTEVAGVPYGAFIVPGLVMLSVFTQSIFNASFGIYFPKFTGTIYEILSAPLSPLETVAAYVGAAASKSMLVGAVTLATAALFVPLQVQHPLAMIGFLVLIAVDLQPVRLHHRRWCPRASSSCSSYPCWW